MTAWQIACATLLAHRVLDGFRQWWRKAYVLVIDAAMPALLLALRDAPAAVPVADAVQAICPLVADEYGYARDDGAEQRIVARLVDGAILELVDVGAVARHGDVIVLTELDRAFVELRLRIGDAGS